MRIRLLFMILIYGSPLIAQDSIIKMPVGESILVDGNISNAEWNDAEQIIDISGFRILVKSSQKSIFIGIEGNKNSNIIADLYCTTDTILYNLHASAKLGQRRYTDKRWDNWDWWNNKGWVANTLRTESFEEKKFLKQAAVEFQIQKSFFQSKQAKIFIEVTIIKDDKNFEVIAFPGIAKSNDSGNWISVRWE